MKNLYEQLVRPLLFSLEAETAHHFTIASLRRASHFDPALRALKRFTPPSKPKTLFGLTFPNPIGLAAGLDKNGVALPAWAALGFGFIEIGTVTAMAQPGNPRPRMFRLPAQQALINRLGFNNQGVDALVARAARARRHAVLGINIGKNADTPLELAEYDYLACLHKVYPVADYVVVNISSPNTVGLRQLQEAERFEQLLVKLGEARETLAQRHGKRRPLLVKIAPDMDDVQLLAIADAARRHGIDGLIATNTTVARSGLETQPMAAEQGGLSGAPLRSRADAVLATLRSSVGADYPLIGVGGILSGADAEARRK